MNDGTEPKDAQLERRRAPRSALRLSATIREPGRSRLSVRVIDISTHGCRVETTGGPSPDRWVLLSIAGLETQYCRVVWQRHDFAGLEFATPLAEPVLETLLQGSDTLSESAISELREIAKRTHRLATRQPHGDNQPLADLSHKCALDAVVEGLRLGEAARKRSGAADRSRKG